jgi:hypothetical protein
MIRDLQAWEGYRPIFPKSEADVALAQEAMTPLAPTLRLVPSPVDGLRAGETLYTQLATEIYDQGFEPEDLLAAFIGAHGVKAYLEPEEPSFFPNDTSHQSSPNITDGD